MITSKEVSTMFQANPFGGKIEEADNLEEMEKGLQQSIDEARDLGLDLDEIAPWAMDAMRFPGEIALLTFGPRVFGSMFVSGLRIGFFLGRGYEDG